MENSKTQTFNFDPPNNKTTLEEFDENLYQDLDDDDCEDNSYLTSDDSTIDGDRDWEDENFEIEEIIGLDATGAVCASAKTGLGVKEILEQIVYNIPSPIEQQLISDDEISESDESSEGYRECDCDYYQKLRLLYKISKYSYHKC